MCWGVNTHICNGWQMGKGGSCPKGGTGSTTTKGKVVQASSQSHHPPHHSQVLRHFLSQYSWYKPSFAFLKTPKNAVYFWIITVHTSYWNSLWIISFFWIISDHTPTHVKILLDPEKKPEIVNAGTPDQPSQADSLGKTEQTHLLGGGSTT